MKPKTAAERMRENKPNTNVLDNVLVSRSCWQHLAKDDETKKAADP